MQQNPQPLPESVLARYDQSYLDYEERRQFDYRSLEKLGLDDLGFPALAASIIEHARASGRAPRILDVGCATGALLASFQDGGWECIGVEPCVPAARYGRERFGIDIREATLDTAGLDRGYFDIVHASHLIEHLNDPSSFVGTAFDLLATRGFLILTTPNIDGFQARVLGSRWRSVIYDHLYLFSIRTLTRMLVERGGKISRIATWGGWAKGLDPAFIKRPLDVLAKHVGFGDVMSFLCTRSKANEP